MLNAQQCLLFGYAGLLAVLANPDGYSGYSLWLAGSLCNLTVDYVCWL
jgi:hypothetical protein